MIDREMGETLAAAASEYPVVTLLGPRQAGKTTLARATFPDYEYCNLENPEVRRMAAEDPKQFFAMREGPVILDEIQRVPELLSWIQVRVDENKAKGQYILTGSHQLSLHEAVAQSLAGRTALLRLLPLSMGELQAAGFSMDKNVLMHTGFMPRIYDDGLEPAGVYANYFRNYVERDVRQLMEIRNLSLFENFMRLLAGRGGQPLNLSGLTSDVGVSGTTLKEWISLLEASFVIFRLTPYYRNFGKEPNLYFWQDSNRNEVDLIYEKQRRLVPIEIKSAMTWHRDFTANVSKFQRSVSDAEDGYVIDAGDLFPVGKGFTR